LKHEALSCKAGTGAAIKRTQGAAVITSNSAQIDALTASIQEAALPAVWSRGVALTREASFIPDRVGAEELVIRVLLPHKPVHPRVTLWPAEEDAYCDCGDRNEPCIHVVAAVLALKKGLVRPTEPTSHISAVSVSNGVAYRFFRQEKTLRLERWIRAGARETQLGESLTSFIGGIQSGRISHPPVATTQEDFKLDQILSASPRTQASLDRSVWAKILSLLESASDVELDGEKVSASGTAISIQAEIIAEQGGFRLRRKADSSISEVFSQGIVRCGQVLQPVRDPELSSSDRELLRGDGTHFSRRDLGFLVSEIVPRLQRKLTLSLPESGLPTLMECEPRIEFEIDSEGPDTLSVLADLVYGNPPIARVRLDLPQAPLETLSSSSVPARDLAKEKALLLSLQSGLLSELHLQVGNRIRISGDRAPEFLRNLKRYGQYEVRKTRTTPAELLTAQAIPTLTPQFQIQENGEFSVSFASSQTSEKVDAERVFQAWRENREFFPLLSGGWAPLPRDWLSRYGEQIEALLQARGKDHRLSPQFLPELAQLCQETDQACPNPLLELGRRLANFTHIPASELPKDLTVKPRSYQRQGIDWLCFLRDHAMGALLADDMGLGKTLQALCAIRGRTLIVCPTSVLSSWQDQIERFRPALKTSVYHGGARALEAKADVTLTTYGILRLDRETLAAAEWESIVLDEAHVIKNPESQMAQAAHSLRAPFRIALSGTPVENRLSDLWSQFQFVNPGLLGTREDFEDRYGAPISRGDRATESRLRTRIKPFLLRRLKRDVAPELPPRTEVLLHCELTQDERSLYEAILAASRQEVLAQLGEGGSVFAALETLLRLRQACCHPALVPGQAQSAPSSSSKTSLLLETLQTSISMRHRSLVFSQWTSYLDLIEPLLQSAGIDFCRLDGTTPNREEVVRRFQAPDGPPVFLLSLKAGGVGLTLTAADHVFLLDPWWNPTVEDQAADRAHRIGQENPVLIHRLVAKDTLEDQILALQKEKQRLSGAVLEGSAQASQLTREDMMALLS
jgi:superfamily II DNA or RNA helicase